MIRCTSGWRTTSAAVNRTTPTPCTSRNRIFRLQQARHLVRGQIHLRQVAVHDGLGSESQAGQEHQHLLARRVLGLVENDEGPVQRAPAHVGQRSHLDHAALDQARDLFGRHHLVERVIQRPQVGQDFLLQVPRQEAQRLPGLHGGPGQDDARHVVLQQRRHGHGHGQKGLAGAGRSHPDGQFAPADGIQEGGLPEGPRKDRGAAGRHIDPQPRQFVQIRTATLGICLPGVLHGVPVQQHSGIPGPQQPLHESPRRLQVLRRPFDLQPQVSRHRRHPEGLLQRGQDILRGGRSRPALRRRFQNGRCVQSCGSKD